MSNPQTVVLLPLALAFIMFALGLGLSIGDFARIRRQPRALVVGLFCHFVLLPLCCAALLMVFRLPPALSAGFMVIAACPTGTTSNLLTYLAKGDTALAISFTAIASVITGFTLPLIVQWSLAHYMGPAQSRLIPVAGLMSQTMLFLALPVLLGVTVRGCWPARTARMEPFATRVAMLLFALILIGALVRNWTLFRANFDILAPMAVCLNLGMLALGYSLARLASVPRSQAVTLGIETAVQNASLAIVVCSTLLHNEAMSLPGAVYGSLMYVGGLAFALYCRWGNAR